MIRPSAGVFWIRSSTLRRRRCAAIASEPYSTKRAGIDELGDVLARGALVGLAPPLDRARTVLVARDGVPRVQLGEISADMVEIDLGFLGDIVLVEFDRLEEQDRLALHQGGAGAAGELQSPCRHAAR